jgi:hypothetical protein
MTMPLRKPDETEELTTADLAHSANRAEEMREAFEDAESESTRPKIPVRSEHSVAAISERRTKGSADATPLFPEDQLRELESRWNDIQTGFVDEPRSAVQHADSLVASTMQQLAEAFSRERSQLEQQWSRGDSVSTEDLRVSFQRYRSFFQRILSM